MIGTPPDPAPVPLPGTPTSTTIGGAVTKTGSSHWRDGGSGRRALALVRLPLAAALAAGLKGKAGARLGFGGGGKEAGM